MDVQDTVRSPTDDQVQIRIIEDNVRALASQLQSQILEVALRRVLHNLPPHKRRTREADFLNLHMRRYGLSDGGPCASHDVKDARRKSRLRDQGGHPKGRQGSEFGRLEDYAITTSQCRSNFPAQK